MGDAAHVIETLVEERQVQYCIASCWEMVESRQTSAVFDKCHGKLLTVPLTSADIAVSMVWYMESESRMVAIR